MNVKQTSHFIGSLELAHLRRLKAKLDQGIAGPDDATSLAELIDLIEKRAPLRSE